MSVAFAIAAMLAELASGPGLVVLVPLVSAIGLAFVPNPRLAGWINAAAATLTLGLAAALPFEARAGLLLRVDPLAAAMAGLTAFVGATTVWFAHSAAAPEAGRAEAAGSGAWCALFQLVLGGLLLALLSNNVPATWVGFEAATIGAICMTGLPRTEEAGAAASKQALLCGGGLALAFVGSTLLYLAAVPALGSGLPAMTWSRLAAAASGCQPALLSLALGFLLLGYATLAGLAPLHAWVVDATAEGAAPGVSVFSGCALNVALIVILRVRGLLAANAGAIAPGAPIMALGLASVLLAAASLWRQRDAKRLFGQSTIGQSGVAAFAFGLGSPVAIAAGLLHLVLHTLTKAAIFQGLYLVPRREGRFDDLAGLLARHRGLGLTLAAAIVALAGLPPFGLFTTTFLILLETARRLPGLALPLALGVGVCGVVLLRRLVFVVAGEPAPDRGVAPPVAALVPAWVHLALVLVLGLAMPGPLAGWLAAMAEAVR
jgi:hydrogenase-4 component F